MACIVKNQLYVEFVALDTNGAPLFWNLSEEEEIVNTAPPALRSEWSRDGLLKPALLDGKWVESATAEELTAWDIEHPAAEPAPNLPNPSQPSTLGELDRRVRDLERAAVGR